MTGQVRSGDGSGQAIVPGWFNWWGSNWFKSGHIDRSSRQANVTTPDQITDLKRTTVKIWAQFPASYIQVIPPPFSVFHLALAVDRRKRALSSHFRAELLPG